MGRLTSLLRGPAQAFYRARGYYPVRIKGREFQCDPFHLGFWREVNRGAWEPQTFDILDEFLGSGSIFVDVGAWIGPTTLFAARKAERVFCFEPDPRAFDHLSRNIRRNGAHNVTAYPLGLAGETGVRRIAAAEGLGSSHTSLVIPGGDVEETSARFLGWTEWYDTVRLRLDLIKIDIEGGEFELVPAMKDYLRTSKPILYLSLHAPLLSDRDRNGTLAEVAETLGGYRHCYDEDRRPIPARTFVDAASHGFRSFLFTD